MAMGELPGDPPPELRPNPDLAAGRLASVPLLLDQRRRGCGPTLRSRRQEASRRGREAALKRATAPSNVRRLQRRYVLQGHQGCVNTVAYDATGEVLVSGSDDRNLNFWAPQAGKPVVGVGSNHVRNIFCARFVPGRPLHVVSCGLDGCVRLMMVDVAGRRATSSLLQVTHHMVTRIAFSSQCTSMFLASHGDGTVRLYDVREPPQTGGEERRRNVAADLLREGAPGCGRRRMFSANSVEFSPTEPWCFAAAGGDPYIRLFDVRKLDQGTGASPSDRFIRAGTGETFPPHDRSLKGNCFLRLTALPALSAYAEQECQGVTGCCFDSRGGQLAATYSGDDVYCFQLPGGAAAAGRLPERLERPPTLDCSSALRGRRNCDTMLKEVAFFLADQYVVSGGDCGQLFLWRRDTGEIHNVLAADNTIVNGVAVHPWLPQLASCGIDPTVKIWEPGEPADDAEGRAASLLRESTSVSGRLTQESEGMRCTEDLFMAYAGHIQAAHDYLRRQQVGLGLGLGLGPGAGCACKSAPGGAPAAPTAHAHPFRAALPIGETPGACAAEPPQKRRRQEGGAARFTPGLLEAHRFGLSQELWDILDDARSRVRAHMNDLKRLLDHAPRIRREMDDLAAHARRAALLPPLVAPAHVAAERARRGAAAGGPAPGGEADVQRAVAPLAALGRATCIDAAHAAAAGAAATAPAAAGPAAPPEAAAAIAEVVDPLRPIPPLEKMVPELFSQCCRFCWVYMRIMPELQAMRRRRALPECLTVLLRRALLLRARCRMLLGNSQGAVADCDLVLTLAESCVDAYFVRANAKQLQGDVAGSLADADSADECAARRWGGLNRRPPEEGALCSAEALGALRQESRSVLELAEASDRATQRMEQEGPYEELD